ncbi:MAG: SDR family NAD(P)-dependent oxidoreductase [Pseudomonadota bacterium]
MKKFTTGLVIVITGAAAGISRALALRCAQWDNSLVLLDCDEPGLASLQEEISKKNGHASVVCCDLAQLDSIAPLGAHLATRLDRVDWLILGAASIGELSPIAAADNVSWGHVMTINALANQRLLASLDPLLRRSIDAHVALLTCPAPPRPAYWSAYQASKAAACEILKAYADETPQITARCIDPGKADTRLHRQAYPGIVLNRTADQAAQHVLKHLQAA